MPQRLEHYLRLVARYGWIIVVAVAITVASAWGFSKLQTPIYRSTVYLNVWPSRLDLSLQQTIQSLMRNYASTIQSRETAMAVVQQLELDITPEQFIAKLSVEPVETDYMIRISADDYDPLIARDIAQKTAEVFVQNIQVFMLEQEERDRVDVSILDNAMPGEIHKPRTDLNMAAGAFFGLAIGVLAVWLLRRQENLFIRSHRQLEEATGVEVLGVIPMPYASRNAGASRRA